MVELMQYWTSMGMSPSIILIVGLFWKQDKRLTIVETIVAKSLEGKKHE